MTTILLSLGTSFFFGCADFLGGVAARRDSAFIVTAASHLVGGLLLVPVLFLLPQASWGPVDMAWGAFAGAVGGIGVAALYGALAVGHMSVVAPITAALAGALPAVFDLLNGNAVGPWAIFGMVLAVVAVVIVSVSVEREGNPRDGYHPTLSIALAITAGTGFAAAIVAFSLTSDESGLWPLLAARAVSVLLIGSTALVRRGNLRLAKPAVAPTVSAGTLEMFANYTMITAIRIGPLSIAAVLGSLYPIVVVMLARAFLHERLKPMQWIGVSLAMVAVLLTALPS